MKRMSLAGFLPKNGRKHSGINICNRNSNLSVVKTCARVKEGFSITDLIMVKRLPSSPI